MTELLTLRDKLKNIYVRYDMIINHVLRFAAALIAFLAINGMTGYNSGISSPLIAIILAAVCCFLPGGITVFAGCCLISLQFYSLSVEFAAVAVVILLIMLSAYAVFSTKTGYVLLAVSVLFWLRLPYVIPVFVGLTAGLAGVIPTVFGTYLYFTLRFSKDFAASVSSFGEEDFVQKLTFIMDNTIMDRKMLVMAIVFAATIILVCVIKSFSMDHSWSIAIVTGSVVEAILVVMSHVMLSLDFSMPGLILGTLAAIMVGFVLQFFFFSVDYSRTERVQFEDDDYYYYVKAVPKLAVTKTEVKVKKINSRAVDRTHRHYDEEGYSGQDYGNDENTETEEEDLLQDDVRRKAYEQDIIDLEEEE